MTRRYQKKYLPDGTLNPQYKNRYQRVTLPDGTPNPNYRKGGKTPYQRATLPDGTPNPNYQNKRGKKRGKDTFIGIDGEGVTLENGKHIYVLLLASTGEHILNEQGLSTVDCFDFLLDLANKYPHGIFVCFGASYDVNMMLGDVPKNVLQELWDGRDNNEGTQSPTYRAPNKRDYSLSYRPRKSFTLRRYGIPKFKEVQNKKTGKWNHTPNYDASLVLWDVFRFFQTSFVKTLENWFSDYLHDGIITFPDEITIDLDRMKAMKKARQSFTTAQLEQEIKPYCLEEVRALQKLMERLRGYLVDDIGVTLSRWDGAGAIASALLKREGIKVHLQETFPSNKILAKILYDAQLRAYLGGRIELGQFGTFIGDVYNDDINSAYPFAMPFLPSLTSGKWEQKKGESTHPYSLSHVTWKFDPTLPYFPFPYRDKHGSIYFPSEGEGWYWKPEIEAAQRAIVKGQLSTQRMQAHLEILESWEFTPITSIKPLAFVKDLYTLRARWKRENNPAEKVLKLGINSLSGKLAQSLGGTEEKKPAYHNIGWAGYITSYTRAKIFDAIMQAPDKIIMSATDGIYSTIPLKLDRGDKLGQWEEKRIDGIIAVQAGIYWGMRKQDPSDEDRQSDHFNEQYYQHNGIWYKLTPHYRGFDKGSLTPQTIMDAWPKVTASDHCVPIPSTRFVTLGSALASESLFKEWRTWRTIERQLDLLPQNKRVYATRDKPLLAHKQLLMTKATPPPQELEEIPISYPYKLKWDREEPYGTEDGVDKSIVDQEIAEGEEE